MSLVLGYTIWDLIPSNCTIISFYSVILPPGYTQQDLLFWADKAVTPQVRELSDSNCDIDVNTFILMQKCTCTARKID